MVFFEFEFIKPQLQQVARKPLGPTNRMEKGSMSDTQGVGSHRSDGDRERCHRVQHDRHMTHKPSGPTGQMEMEKGAVGSHKSDGEGYTSC